MDGKMQAHVALYRLMGMMRMQKIPQSPGGGHALGETSSRSLQA